MEEKKEKYINPFTDYGFKRLFGEEPSKDLLLDFLNELLGDKEGKIKELSYQSTENLPITIGNRKAIFDIYCTNEKGEKFIVEMQKVEQQYFKDRMLFYSTFPIQVQAKDKGKNWDFNLKHVYAIGILDFSFKEDEPDPEKYRYDAKITEIETGEIFYDKLTFTYLAMEKFNKELDQINSKFEKWLYVIKNLSKLDRVPEKLREEIFIKFFQIAEIAKMKEEEYREYEASLNAYRDIKNSVDFAEKKGIEKGIEKGEESKTMKVVLIMNEKGYSNEEIAEVTELSIERVVELLKQINEQDIQ
ncbi:MAG: Rpn family recombination-promoting nuclease/putative transposase [Bacteroidales bacterium]|nr:Rpn family recombination-promoting nuclease/putative transposase [Bacteroidales bacterium]MCF8456284.1 Rpn family recombination-promoting nuclease/putative transposase [Bacteroidales bacterium]